MNKYYASIDNISTIAETQNAFISDIHTKYLIFHSFLHILSHKKEVYFDPYPIPMLTSM